MPRKKSTKRGDLDAYRGKRSPETTPEPFGDPAAERPGLFVVQLHAARRLHYDFRLEIGGVLRSWAVPKGPSLDPADKRLAVATEDHPVEYGEFEGIIPSGSYGAGAVVVWDRGLAIHRLDPAAGIESGKLLFELRGYKLRGLWTLVRTKRSEREWLLIKKPDAAASGQQAEELGAGSVFSGLTVEELRQGPSRAREVEAELETAGARRHTLKAAAVKPMLARLRREAFSDPAWLFELKYDGYRAIAGCGRAAGGDRGALLRYRSGREATGSFPDLARALSALPFESLVLDGEITVLDDEARPRFDLLQQRARLSRPADIERAAVRLPAVLFAFDLLGFGPYDLRSLPLRQRKELLRRVLPAAGPLRFADHVEGRGEELFAKVREAGLEGLIAKRADSRYRGGRSSDWLKLRADRVNDFAVVGYTRPSGPRAGFGALHLGVMEGPRMVYAGRVGSGFTEPDLEEIRGLLEGTRCSKAPVSGQFPTGAEYLWVEPRLVVEVRFTEYTAAGQLRQPVFLRLREEKRPEECVRDEVPPQPELSPAAPATRRQPRVEVSRPEKIFWPDEGFSKGDLVAYYRTVSPWLLPYLRDRPVVLDRYPDGIGGKSFFQKNAPEFVPEWIRVEGIWSGEGGEESRAFVCDDVETLAYLINLGSIPLHLWSSRMRSLQRPDWCLLDLDAKDAPFESVVRVARVLRRLCREIGLDSFAKTSGGSGMHVLIPLGGYCTHQQSRQLADLLARVVARELPEVASLVRTPAMREGRVYLDCLQNGHGKLLVAPFSVRPLPGAPVSMPLRWREVRPRLDPRRFTIASAPARLRRWRSDPLAPVLELEPDLQGALDRLGRLLQAEVSESTT